MAMNTAAFSKRKMRSWRKSLSIPYEITFHILSHLPVKSLMRFKCISQFHNSLVSDKDFVNKHQSLSMTRPGRIKLTVRQRESFYTIEQIEDGESSLFHIEHLDKLY